MAEPDMAEPDMADRPALVELSIAATIIMRMRLLAGRIVVRREYCRPAGWLPMYAYPQDGGRRILQVSNCRRAEAFRDEEDDSIWGELQ